MTTWVNCFYPNTRNIFDYIETLTDNNIKMFQQDDA